MNRNSIHVLLVILAGTLAAPAARAASSTIGELLAKIDAAAPTAVQQSYSRELHKSVNSAAVRAMAQDCAQQRSPGRASTFSMLGVVRIDGVLSSPIPMPVNAFTACVAASIGSTHFPLPPGDGKGWPVAIQFETATGKVAYVAGDALPAMPRYSNSPHWVHTPLPPMPEKLARRCSASLWLNLDTDGRVNSAEQGDSECPAAFNASALEAARQWMGMDKQKKADDAPMDVRITFVLSPGGMRVTL